MLFLCFWKAQHFIHNKLPGEIHTHYLVIIGHLSPRETPVQKRRGSLSYALGTFQGVLIQPQNLHSGSFRGTSV